MKSVIAYALLVVGLPQLVGLLVGSLVSLPFALLIPHHLKFRLVPLLEVFPGSAALAAAVALFYVLAVSVSAAVPIILACWISFYFLAYQQRKIEWVAFSLGIGIAWVVYRLYLSPA